MRQRDQSLIPAYFQLTLAGFSVLLVVRNTSWIRSSAVIFAYYMALRPLMLHKLKLTHEHTDVHLGALVHSNLPSCQQMTNWKASVQPFFFSLILERQLILHAYVVFTKRMRAWLNMRVWVCLSVCVSIYLFLCLSGH